jgi:electron transfer flavoprotein alpha subunit
VAVNRALIIAEHDGVRVDENLRHCIACAQAIGADEIVVAILARATASLTDHAARIDGVTHVIGCEHEAFGDYTAAAWAAQIAPLAVDFTHVLAASSAFGRDLMPRCAGLLGVGQLSDVTRVHGPYRFTRTTYAGNAVVTIDANPDRRLLATVRATAFPGNGDHAGAAAPIVAVAPVAEIPTHTRFRQRDARRNVGRELQSADRVVAGGRGLGSSEAFALVHALADALDAAVGASRAAVDAGYVTNDLQVGQTGKIIAPELYVALGISGAIQHVTGIRDAGTIVAVNRDADAPIFDIADVGLVADLFEAVPTLIERLRAAGPPGED